MQEYKYLQQSQEYKIWIKAFVNDLGRLVQGVGARMPKGNNSIFLIPRGKVPKFKTVTYGRIVSEIRPHKIETHRFRITVGGDRLKFDDLAATQCAGMVTTKLLFNSSVSTPGDRFCTIEINDFYYGIPISDYEYMRIQLAAIPQVIIDQYYLGTIQHKGWVYIEIQKGMPVLNKSGMVDNDHLCTH